MQNLPEPKEIRRNLPSAVQVEKEKGLAGYRRAPESNQKLLE